MNAKFTKMILAGISIDPKFIDRLSLLIPEIGDERTLLKLSDGVKVGIKSVDIEGANADKKLLDGFKNRDMENFKITDISYYSTDEVKIGYEYDRVRWFDNHENAKKYEKDGETWNRNAKESMTDTHTFSATHHFLSSTTRDAEKLSQYVIFDIL
jgi:hypothetical protein